MIDAYVQPITGAYPCVTKDSCFVLVKAHQYGTAKLLPGSSWGLSLLTNNFEASVLSEHQAMGRVMYTIL